MYRGASEVVILFVGVVAVLVIVALGEAWSPEAWAALAGWVTAAIAAVAGVLALGQLTEARNVRIAQEKSRREQAQPYVVAQIEESIAASMIFDLVVRNYGATAAFDVRLKIDPPPQRAIDTSRPPNDSEYTWLPESLALLVPGQEWRTLWDNQERVDSGLPDHHDVTITFRDSDGVIHEFRTVLDWGLIKNRHVVSVYGMHQAATALREMNKTIKDFKETGSRGMRVWSRDGDEADRRRQARYEGLRAEQAAANENAAVADDQSDSLT